MHRPRTLILALTLSGAHGCLSGNAGPDPAILRLGDEQVRRSEFEHHLAELVRRGADPTLRREFLGPFLEERVLVLEARARGLVKAGAGAEEEKAAVETLLSQALPAAAISDDEVARYRDGHLDEFHRPETVTVRQILVPTENEARDMRRRLLRDPKSFDLLARTRSRSPEASTGGLMGTFERGQLPSELENAAFVLPAGGTSDIVRSPLGFHVLRVEARQAAREESLEEIGTRIRTQLQREKTAQALRAFVQQLLSRAKVNHEVALSTASRS
jgi:parvulin-like peptidyl-prolyl isomerase